MLDGELVAWRGREPWFPSVCRRVLNYDLTVYSERRDLLVSLDLRGPSWVTADAFDDGPALYAAVCVHGLEGVVAKKLSSRYRPGERGWVKAKNPNYWRRDSEIEAMQSSRKRRRRTSLATA